jgi:hypothetical protein
MFPSGRFRYLVFVLAGTEVNGGHARGWPAEGNSFSGNCFQVNNRLGLMVLRRGVIVEVVWGCLPSRLRLCALRMRSREKR